MIDERQFFVRPQYVGISVLCDNDDVDGGMTNRLIQIQTHTRSGTVKLEGLYNIIISETSHGLIVDS